MKKNCPPVSRKINPITSLIFLLCLLLAGGILANPNPTIAQVMEGQNYQLRLQDVYEKQPTPTAEPAVVTTAPLPTPPPIRSFGQSDIVVSDNAIDFGPLSPTDPVIRQLSFTIKGQSLLFSLYQHLDHDLLNDPGDAIPATSCDNGSCTLHQASLWNSTLTYGIGVRCDNLQDTVCPEDFIEKNTFRPLGGTTDQSSIIASGTVRDKATINLTYKLVTSGTQPPGNYAATASYILIPGI